MLSIEEVLDRLLLDQLFLGEAEFLVGDLDLEQALLERLRWNSGVQLQKFHSLPFFQLLGQVAGQIRGRLLTGPIAHVMPPAHRPNGSRDW